MIPKKSRKNIVGLVWFACVMGWGPGLADAAPPQPRSEPPTSDLLLMARYMNEVHQKIQRFWNVKGISFMDLHRRSVVLQLWVDQKGRVLKFRITQSSGLPAMDRSLIDAVRKAHPFAPPPRKIVSLLKIEGLEITVKRRVLRKKLLPVQPHYRGTAVVPNWRPKVDEKTVKNRKK